MPRKYAVRTVRPPTVEPQCADKPLLRAKYQALHEKALLNFGPSNHPDFASNTQIAIWNMLPKSKKGLLQRIVELRILFAGVPEADRPNLPIYKTILHTARLKLACRLTERNPWRLGRDAFPRGYEIQQLRPLWATGMTHAIGLSFIEGTTPEEIAYQCTQIVDKVLRPLGLTMLRVISKHRKSVDQFSGWHVHGIVWPSSRISRGTFSNRLKKMQNQLRKGSFYLKKKVYTKTIENLAGYAWYLARNLASSYDYRRHLREKAQNSNMPISQDAGQGIRFFAAPPKLLESEWQSWATKRGADEKARNPEEFTPFMCNYRQSKRKLAERLRLTEEEVAEIAFSWEERQAIFKDASDSMPPDKPRIPWIASPDGHVYQVLPVSAAPWEAETFHLVRAVLPSDIVRMPEEVRKHYRAHHDKLIYPVLTGDLEHLAKLAVEYALPDWQKIIDPSTGNSVPNIKWPPQMQNWNLPPRKKSKQKRYFEVPKRRK